MKRTKTFLLTLTLIMSSFIYAQKSTTVEKIVGNPNNYNGESVEVKGTVIQYVYSSTSTSFYLLKGDYGGIIKVNTADPAPETYKKYSVSGIVYLERTTNEPFISEKSKIPIGTILQPNEKTFWEFLKDYYIIIALGFILIIMVVVLIYINRKRSVRAQTLPAFEYGPEVDKSAAISQEPAPAFSSEEDFKTIRIATSSPKTLKFIPGELIISDGEDKGKSFKIAGYPTAEGAIVSIGREEVRGDRAYSHIQLKQKTVGRKQAELIHKDGKLYIKNLGEVNYTQMDGVELKPGEKAEIRPGSTIRTGEVEFQYKV